MKYLIDTNVLAETLKPRPDFKVRKIIASVPRSDLFTSAICVVELRGWARRAADPGKRWAQVQASCLCNLEVLPFDAEDALNAGDLLFDLQREGVPMPQLDALIAACALRHGLTLVTRDVGDFRRVPGLELENWFE